MSVNAKELVASTHPIFKVPATQIFWYDKVQKVNTHGNLQERHLAIATPGIFLFEMRTFPRSLAVSRIIPFSELILIRLEGNTVQFYCAKVTIILQHPDFVEIAAIAYSIRQSLFGDKPRPPKLAIEKEYQQKFESSNFVFESKSLLADRFLSLSLNNWKQYSIDQVMFYWDQLSQITNSITVDGSITSSSFVSAYINSIAFDSDITELTLQKCSLATITEQFMNILENNSVLTKIIFDQVSFSDFVFKPTKSKKFSIKVRDFIFDGCDLTSADFSSFFENVSKYSRNILGLTFSGCGFTEETYNSVFANIFEAACFGHTETLEFNGFRNLPISIQPKIVQLFGAQYHQQNKSLRVLKATDCSLSIDQMIPSIFRYDTNISHLGFAGNNLLGASELDAICDFRQLKILDVSRCHFTGPSLIALFRAIERARRAPSRLIADSLCLDSAAWFDFYATLPSVTATKLTALSWRGNQIKPQQFGAFLAAQQKLVELAVTAEGEDANYITELAHMLSPLHLQKFALSGAGPAAASIEPVLRALHGVRDIDVTGQACGDRCLDELAQIASEGSLVNLAFDGSTPSSVDFLLSFLGRLVDSGVVNASWPESDLRNLMLRLPITQRAEVNKRVDGVRRLFAAKIGTYGQQPVPTDKGVEGVIGKSEPEQLGEVEAEVMGLLRECLLSRQGEVSRDPLVECLYSLNRTFAVESLSRE